VRGRLRAKVYGMVQGVGFRYFVKKEARALGLTGWVRNCSDGSVEVVAEGDRKELELLLSILQRGSPFSIVQRVDHSWENYKGEFKDFEVRY